MGTDNSSLRTVAASACRQMGLSLQTIPLEALPTDWQQLKLLQTLCEREYSLSGTAILLDCDT